MSVSNKEQSKKLYSVTDKSNGQGMYVKAKSKLAALRYAVENGYVVEEVNARNADLLAQALAAGDKIYEA